jgi:hypothetical protein
MVGRYVGISQEQSFHPQNLRITPDAPENCVRVASKSAIFRQLVGAPPKSKFVKNEALGAKLRHKLVHGYAKVKTAAKLVTAINNAERHIDAADALAAFSLKVVKVNEDDGMESSGNQLVILPESRFKFSSADTLASRHPTPDTLLRSFLEKVSPEELTELKSLFKLSGPDSAFVQLNSAETSEDSDTLDHMVPIEAMNRNARMPKAANHVRAPSIRRVLFIFLHHSLFSFLFRASVPLADGAVPRKKLGDRMQLSAQKCVDSLNIFKFVIIAVFHFHL